VSGDLRIAKKTPRGEHHGPPLELRFFRRILVAGETGDGSRAC